MKKIKHKQENYIGCSGWHYKEWKETFYPKTLHTKDYFSYYASYFNTVEINNTFYNFPEEKSMYNWYKQAPKNFKYSIKVNRNITHIKRFKDIEELLIRSYGISDILAEKTGCFLFQFPPSFCFTIERLERIISQLNPIYKNVLEFRHPSWWVDEVATALSRSDITFCSVRGFGLPQKLIGTGNRTYTRFHGDPLYSGSYTGEELLNWARIVKNMSVEENWMYFNNTMHGHSISNASTLKQLLS